MNCRKIMLISLIVLILSVAAVSAGDADNMTIQTGEVEIIGCSDDVVSQDSLQDDVVGSANEDNVLNASLADLQSQVNSVGKGGTLDLSTDYSGGSAVTISKSMTINGNNHVLDANGKNRIFTLSDGVDVVLKNIVFKNGFTDNGGAVANYYSSSSLTLINCNFLSNHAKLLGGAVYSAGNLNIDGCTFSSNVVDDDDGGAVYSTAKTTITGSVFSDNTVKGSTMNICNGGAVSTVGDLTIGSCKFTNNFADDNGGAVYNQGTLNVNGCDFESNTADDDNGGAIYCKGNINVRCSIFKSNKAYIDGGAIFCEGVTDITYSEFTGNSAKGSSNRCFGGAVRSKGTCYITGCDFMENHAEDYGGAIYADGALSIMGEYYNDGRLFIESTFKDNSAVNYGGAVYVGGSLYVNWLTTNPKTHIVHFSSNSVTNDDGGAIYCCKNIYINNAGLSYNTALVDGGAIFCKGETTIKDSSMTYNSATGSKLKCYGGAIRSKGNCYIYSSTIEINNADNYGGAIYADKDLTINGNSQFWMNKVSQHGGAAYVCGSLYINWNEENPNWAVFQTCIAKEDNGGALYCRGNAYINKAMFVKCESGLDGGAIYAEKEVYIKNSEFSENYAESMHIVDVHSHYGGAIRSAGLVTVDGSHFFHNLANGRGGAIYSDSELRVSNCLFDWNGADNYGGAIYAEKFEQLSNSLFTKNYASSDDGGAIYINANCDPNIVSCAFIENHCGDEGGAIFLDSVYTDLKISYCTFIDNSAADKGQAVYNSGDYDCVDYCWYGTNNPSFSDLFKIYHRVGSDDDYGVSNYAILNLKVNDTNLFVGNKYQLSAYFTTNTGSKLDGKVIGYEWSFGGDGTFSNKKDGYNEFTTDVVFTKEYPTVSASIDHQTVYLSPNVINKYPSVVNILSCDDIVYPDPFEVTFEVIGRNKVSYVIKDDQGRILKQGNLDNGENSLVVKGFTPGNYSITISNSESFDHLSSSATANFKVKPLYNVTVSADEVTFGEITTITMKSDIDALFNVTIDNYGVIQMEVINGTATSQLKLNAGIYDTHTTINMDDCAIKCTEATFVVNSIPIHIWLAMNETFAYPNDIVGEVGASRPGEYGIYIDGKLITTVNVTDKPVRFNVGTLQPSTSYMVTSRSMDKNYWDVAIRNIEVVKGIFDGFSMHIQDGVYSSNFIAECYTTLENRYVIQIGDYEKPIYLRESGFNSSIGSDWDAGSYNAKLLFDGNKYYVPSAYSTLFTVHKANSDLNLNSKVLSYGGNIEITHSLPSRATGYIEYYLKDGTLIGNLSVNKNLNLDSLAPGHYEIVAKYCGDKNYNSSSDTIGIDVTSAFGRNVPSDKDVKSDDEIIDSASNEPSLSNIILFDSYSSDGVGLVDEVTDLAGDDSTNSSNSTAPVKSIAKESSSNFNYLWILLLILIVAAAGVLIKKYKD